MMKGLYGLLCVPRDGDQFKRKGEGKGDGVVGANGLEGGLGQQAWPNKAAFEGVGGASWGVEEDSQGQGGRELGGKWSLLSG